MIANSAHMKSLSTWILDHKGVALLVLAVVVFGSYSFFFRNDEMATSTVTTKTAEATRGTLKVTVSGSGQVQADSQVDLKPVAAGDAIEVTAVMVKNDQAVKKGQIIATIDSEDALRDVRQAELSLKSAKIKLQQTELDYSAKTKEETLVRRAQETVIRQQELTVQKALSKLSDYSIRAPFDGIVTGLDVDGGDTISQTTILASVITKEMKAVIALNEVDVVKIKVGDTVTLTLDALSDAVLSGKIAKLDTIGTATQGVVSYGATVILDEQHEALRPGMTVTADIAVKQKDDVVMVPNGALTYEEGKTYVRVATVGKVNTGATTSQGEKRAVMVGITDNVHTEIVSGLQEKESVIVTSSPNAVTSQASGAQGGWPNSLIRGRSSGSR